MKIGNTYINLGASVNIIPLPVVEKIWYLQIEPNTRYLQMVYKICRTPVGIIKDGLIHIDKFSFPIDFMILDVKADPNIPLILGRTFMKTARILVDVDKGEVKVRIKFCELSYKVIGVT